MDLSDDSSSFTCRWLFNERGVVDPVMMDEPEVAVEIGEDEVVSSGGNVDEEGAVLHEGGMVLLTLDELVQLGMVVE